MARLDASCGDHHRTASALGGIAGNFAAEHTVTAVTIASALGCALALAAEGYRCFPCRADKRPATPHGFHDAASDRTAVRALWRQYPAPLVGVATGAASGIDGFDLDAKHSEARQWWATHRHRLPLTRTHGTRSGGLHLLFRHATGLRCTAGRIAPGVDTRGDGGYIVWWPAAGLPVLSDAPAAPWPAWLLVDLQSSPSSARSESKVTIPDEDALAGLVLRVACAAEGERNALTFWAACRAGEMSASGLLGAETAASVITNAAIRAGLPQAEAQRTTWSGIRTGLGSAPRA